MHCILGLLPAAIWEKVPQVTKLTIVSYPLLLFQVHGRLRARGPAPRFDGVYGGRFPGAGHPGHASRAAVAGRADFPGRGHGCRPQVSAFARRVPQGSHC